MATYTGQQRFLLQAATIYSNLGYRVGFARGKEYLGEYQAPSMTMWGPVQTEHPEGFDGISLIPDGIVCVDIDINDFGMIYEGLPPSVKERTPRGWHVYYRLPIAEMVHGRTFTPKIKWREHVDLLCKPMGIVTKKSSRASRYGGMKEDGSPWGEHVLCSPTTGYQRLWPDEMPPKDKLVEAPVWLQDALEKP